MKVNIECKSCHRRYAVAEQTVGKKVRCQQCGTTFLAEVAAPAAAVRAAAVTPAAPAARKPPPGPRPSPAPGKVPPPPLEPEPLDDLELLDEPRAAPIAPAGSAPPLTKGWAQLAPSSDVVPAYALAAPVVIEHGRPRIRVAEVSPLQMAISRILIVIYLCAMVGIIVKVLEITGVELGSGTAESKVLGGVLLAMLISRAVLLVAITATLFYLAEVLAGALMRFQTANYGFLRAVGIAGLVDAGLLGMIVLNPDTHATRYVLIGALVVASGLLLWFTYGLKPLEAVATAGLSGIAFVIGWFAIGWLSMIIATSGIVPLKATVDKVTVAINPERAREHSILVLFPPEKKRRETDPNQLNRPAPWQQPDYARGNSGAARSGPSNRFAGGDNTGGASSGSQSKLLPLDYFRAGYDSVKRRISDGNISREAAEKKLAEARKWVLDEKQRMLEIDKSLDPSNWPVIEHELQEAQEQIAALPSEKPDPALFQTPAAADAFVPDATAARSLSYRETAVGHYRFRLPVLARQGLATGAPSAEGIRTWDWGLNDAQFIVKIIPATNPQQKQPWVVQRQFLRDAARGERLLAIEAFGGASTVKSGQLAGLPATRVQYNAAGGNHETWIEYVARDDNDWISLRARSDNGGSESVSIIEDAIRTLHDQKSPPVSLVKPGSRDNPAGPPLTGAEVAEWIENDRGDAKTALLRFGPRAEPGIIECLNHAQPRVRDTAVELLPKVATSSSVDKLKPLLESRHQNVADAVKAVLQKVAPAQFDAVTMALVDVRRDEIFRRAAALKALAAMTPVDARRDEVNALLEPMVLEKPQGLNSADDAADALATWATPKSAAKIIPLLNNPKLDGSMRRRLIKAVSGQHDNKVAAAAVMKWVILAPEDVVTALIRMGPVAEDETVRIFSGNYMTKGHDGEVVRNACLRILTEIGTNKSLDILGRASRDQRDVVSQAAAVSALDAVKARMAAATQPAKVQ